jgi:hypothetical protein
MSKLYTIEPADVRIDLLGLNSDTKRHIDYTQEQLKTQ